MIDVGIFPDDVLVVDRSLRAKHCDIIIASLESEMTVKELHLTPPPVYLLPRNPAYQSILIEDGIFPSNHRVKMNDPIGLCRLWTRSIATLW
jgi:DNA polymerase V